MSGISSTPRTPRAPRVQRAGSAPATPLSCKTPDIDTTELDNQFKNAILCTTKGLAAHPVLTVTPTTKPATDPVIALDDEIPPLLANIIAKFETHGEKLAAREGWVYAAKEHYPDIDIEPRDAPKKLIPKEDLLETFLQRYNDPDEMAAAHEAWRARKVEACRANGVKTFNCECLEGCILDQYMLKDSRTCISNYFGRNKKNTMQVPNPIRYCRKHYQRAGYRKADLEWPRQKAQLIKMQLERNEAAQPGLTYDIMLKKGEQQRLSDHNNGRGRPRSLDAKAFEAPIDVLQHIYKHYVGRHRTVYECIALVDWSASQLSKQHLPDLPLFEMVPEYPGDDGEGEELMEVGGHEKADEEMENPPPSSTSTPHASAKKLTTPYRITKHGAIQKTPTKSKSPVKLKKA